MTRLKIFKYFSEKYKQKTNPISDGSDEILIQRKNLKSYFNFIISKARKKNKKNNIENSKDYNKTNSHESAKDIPFQFEKGLKKSNSLWNKFTTNVTANKKKNNNNINNSNNNDNSNNINVAKTVNKLNKLIANGNFKEIKKNRKSFCFIKNNNNVERTKLLKIDDEDNKKKGIFKINFLKLKNNKSTKPMMSTKNYSNNINSKNNEKSAIPSPNKEISILKNKFNKNSLTNFNRKHAICKMQIKKDNPINVVKDLFSNNMFIYNKSISDKENDTHIKNNNQFVEEKQVLNNIQSKTAPSKQRNVSQIDPQEEMLTQYRNDFIRKLKNDMCYEDYLEDYNLNMNNNNKNNFQRLNCDNLYIHDMYEKSKKKRLRKFIPLSNKKKRRIKPDNFNFLKVIGKGSYGKVLLVKHTQSNKLYAMKILKKDNIISQNQFEHTKVEKNILKCVSHPFIVKMYYSFQTSKKLYFILEYCPGGELFFHLSKLTKFTENIARFYISEIIIALQYLHKLNIIYRDLKPENVLLDKNGHIRLTDFGLSKECISDNNSAKSLCGTPEYLSPEIIHQTGHGKSADWWSLGVMLYEMVTGQLPFNGKSRDLLFENIKYKKIKISNRLSPEVVDLLKKLLQKNPQKRLGSGITDAEEIKKHPFFKKINWDDVSSKKLSPPFKPALFNKTDLQNFDEEFLCMSLRHSDKFDTHSFDLNSHNTLFRDFSYNFNEN
ncbi:rac-beta serine/threonine protein kinase, putative [Plasmodium berghei]|uniref:non-specific serine/threonine protein kinase n=2 Tax=Plasmodium berghei TaxID=5821 RepID=A0A509B1X4_PLABA|nr:rac-beta serine/threonine protein kinase, putative [Plasmodium berghei ANKA]CXJ28669.1 rac-beta serine/threonine protein kinase, putative [Plasmodium berghei]SCM27055.1 rac-beta serine/threonine protein kinase, putative [Plasmodium berghei]SCN28781.1 rac-beta serine/threonine protein kinase, putative [Plasmodium berghei]SCO63063.1 rac-beta serine/threonine protein kinase, putative [Plasmodium berghei]SCO64528.1 rac-beta serine/threonine protein kinase, putative [Plasmodium berghei]|eukprot:XP_034424427.1 rac-beta serine/threonine protein kinase, putative [Plasmodium berghei ANKA]